MQPRLVNEKPEAVAADAVAIVLFEATPDDAIPGNLYDAGTQGLIGELYDSKEFTGKALRTALIHRPHAFQAKRLLLIGGGKRGEFTVERLRQAAGVAVRELKSKGVKRLALVPAFRASLHASRSRPS
jgi:leucyl aminopeptidase